jgi:hypothetical protein
MEYEWKTYHAFIPKEVIEPGDKHKFLSWTTHGELVILDILTTWGQQVDKAHCNMKKVFIHTDQVLQGWEVMYESMENTGEIFTK